MYGINKEKKIIYTHAIVRLPGYNFSQGITEADLGIPDYDLITQQHKEYTNTLVKLGLKVIQLEALEVYPDAYFVEDTAVITQQMAVITNPGAESRKGEIQHIEPVLTKYRQLHRIKPPGTLEGGDVLQVGGHFFIGLSKRTNRQGVEQFGRIIETYGYTWTAVEVVNGLHLKSDVNLADRDTLMVTELYAKYPAFNDYQKIILAEDESRAANSLSINGTILMPSGFTSAKKKLENLSLPIIELDISEVRKMDGGLTCLSLRF